MSRWPTCRLVACAIILCVAGCTVSAQSSRPTAKTVQPSTQQLAAASKNFTATCAGCHGLDGRGSERGPNIASRREVLRRSDAELLKTLRNGIPEAGMPSFATLGTSNLLAMVSYLRTLQGKIAAMPIPGDTRRGESLFFGAARCSECHMLNGRGGFIGSDLSAYAADSSPDEIRHVIVNPDRDTKRGRSEAQVTLRNGDVLEGVVRNEDNFSLQLQTLDGAFHFLQRQEISAVKPSARPIMPENYGQTLSPAELDDIVGYLMSVARRAAQKATTKQEQYED